MFFDELKRLRFRMLNKMFNPGTRSGRIFNLFMFFLIIASLVFLIIENIDFFIIRFGDSFKIIEWGFTLLFILEFMIRFLLIDKHFRYLFSFYGFVDIIAFAPTLITLFVPEARNLQILRTVRLLRLFRALKLVRYLRHFFEEDWKKTGKITGFFIYT